MQHNQNAFWESELRRMFQNSAVLDDFRVAGRVALGRLSDTETVKLKFVTMGTHEKYGGVEATVLNRREGVIDRTALRFGDVWGVKQIPGNPYLKDGVLPHIWVSGGKAEWYAWEPATEDYLQVCGAMDDYLEMFQAPLQAPEQRQTMSGG
jgi:hypothetical protein